MFPPREQPRRQRGQQRRRGALSILQARSLQLLLLRSGSAVRLDASRVLDGRHLGEARGAGRPRGQQLGSSLRRGQAAVLRQQEVQLLARPLDGCDQEGVAGEVEARHGVELGALHVETQVVDDLRVEIVRKSRKR